MMGSVAIVALSIFAAAEANAQPDEASLTLRVLTFNIKHGATMRGDFDLDRIAGVIRGADPDLVALQEVDVRTRRARDKDIAAELAGRTGLYMAFGKAMPYDGGDYGVAILSRFAFESTRRAPLPNVGSHEPRVALAGEVMLPGDIPLLFISTHLEFSSPGARVAQADHLNALFGGANALAILAGDLNATPESETLARLKTQWTLACGDSPAPTFPAQEPRIKIDYILYRPADEWTVRETRVIHDDIASDHCAYLAVLERVAR